MADRRSDPALRTTNKHYIMFTDIVKKPREFARRPRRKCLRRKHLRRGIYETSRARAEAQKRDFGLPRPKSSEPGLFSRLVFRRRVGRHRQRPVLRAPVVRVELFRVPFQTRLHRRVR